MINYRLLSLSKRRKKLTALSFSGGEIPPEFPRDSTGLPVIDSDYCLELKLKEGDEFTLEEICEMFSESEKRRAFSRAVYYLGAQDLPSGKLKQKLRRSFSETACDSAVAKCVENGYIDDVKYAGRLAEKLIAEKGNSAAQTPLLMAARGVDLTLAKQVVSEREDDPKTAIEKLIRTKYKTKITTAEGRKKTMAALARKGFRFGDIKAVLETDEFSNDTERSPFEDEFFE